jgi:hypothetical protein
MVQRSTSAAITASGRLIERLSRPDAAALLTTDRKDGVARALSGW